MPNTDRARPKKRKGRSGEEKEKGGEIVNGSGKGDKKAPVSGRREPLELEGNFF